MSFYMPYSKLYILAELSAYDVTIISVGREKLDLSKYIYLWYSKIKFFKSKIYFNKHTYHIFIL